MNTYLTSQFTYNPSNNTFSAEISDFKEGGFNIEPFIVDGFPINGFRMKSDKTGSTVAFSLREVKYDADNDVQYWHFSSFPAAQFTVILFND